MNFLAQKYKQAKKSIAHYWNPNQNPTEKDKKALQLLDRGEVDMFIQYINQNPDVNLNAVDYNKASFLIKAQDVANNTNQYKKLIPEQELKVRAIKAINFLMEKGVDINYRDKNGGTALMAACHWGNNDIAKILLEKGADVNLGTNNQFFTSPLLSAYFKKNLELVNILLQHNADVQESIGLCSKGSGFKLSEEDMKFLRSIGNIATLVRKRKQEQFLKKSSVLAQMSDMLFDQVCLNV